MADNKLNFCILFLWILATSIEATNVTRSTNTELFRKLFSNYEKAVIPVCDNGVSQINVTMGISLAQIVELDEETQTLKSILMAEWSWTDCRLSWNEQETGVSILNVPADNIWTPGYTVYESTKKDTFKLGDTRTHVFNSGLLTVSLQEEIASRCELDVTYFPFDTQTCILTLTPWTYDVFSKAEKDYQPFNLFIPNAKWDLIETKTENKAIQYACCPEVVTYVEFHIVIRRRPLYYILNLISPGILMAVMSSIVFVLPSESGEKASLSVTILLSMAVFMLVVAQYMPPTSDTYPILGVYFAVVMVLSAVSCFMCVVILSVYHSGVYGKRVPHRIRRICLGRLAQWLFVPITQTHNLLNDEGRTAVDYPVQEGKRLTGDGSNTDDCLPQVKLDNLDKPPNLELNLLRIYTLLHHMMKHPSESTRKSNEDVINELIETEWKVLSRVMDRLCFVVFFLLQSIMAFYVMIKISA